MTRGSKTCVDRGAGAGRLGSGHVVTPGDGTRVDGSCVDGGELSGFDPETFDSVLRFESEHLEVALAAVK